MAAGNFWRLLRIMLLLYVLLFVAVGAWLGRARTTDWDDPLYVGVYPINGDGSTVSEQYIAGLDARSFAAVGQFFEREMPRYGISIRDPVVIEVGEAIADLPPAPPRNAGVLRVMTWSLSLRWWSWRQQLAQPGPRPDVFLYLIYYDPANNPVLAHSLGLEKGLIGVVNAFASRRDAGANNVVLVHELLHTVGATDKYDPATNLPLYPYGYANPSLSPVHPQRRAEIMAGRIALTPSRAVQPENLRQVVVGPLTAAEIRWTRFDD